jgi:hypothetical protein
MNYRYFNRFMMKESLQNKLEMSNVELQPSCVMCLTMWSNSHVYLPSSHPFISFLTQAKFLTSSTSIDTQCFFSFYLVTGHIIWELIRKLGRKVGELCILIRLKICWMRRDELHVSMPSVCSFLSGICRLQFTKKETMQSFVLYKFSFHYIRFSLIMARYTIHEILKMQEKEWNEYTYQQRTGLTFFLGNLSER